MPCIYAHHSFGKKVTKKLSPELKKIIYKHPGEFLAGLQGPDFLFFYRPMFKLRTNRLGYWQHGQPFAPFLKSVLPILRKEGADSGAYAYVMGYICHFMLDSECHSFVIPLAEKPGYNHLAIENEFDRHLMKKDGLIPTICPVWEKIHCTDDIIEAIYQAYRPIGLDRRKIRKSLKGMRFYKWLLTSGCSIKRLVVRFIMWISMHYRQLEGHMMTLQPKKYARKTNQSLQFLYDSAIPATAEILMDFHRTVTLNEPLNSRFSSTFKNSAELT